MEQEKDGLAYLGRNILLENIAVIKYIATKQSDFLLPGPRSEFREEQEAAGVVGFIDALNNYEATNREVDFKTYARSRIVEIMLDEIKRTYKLPENAGDLQKTIDETIISLEEQERIPDDQIITDKAGIGLEEYLAVRYHPSFIHPFPINEFEGALEEGTNVPKVSAEKLAEMKELLPGYTGNLAKDEQYAFSLYHADNLFLEEVAQVLKYDGNKTFDLFTLATVKVRAGLRNHFEKNVKTATILPFKQ